MALSSFDPREAKPRYAIPADPIPRAPINETLSIAVCEMVTRKQRPIRLCDMFMKLWCGSHGPTEDLQLWMQDRNFEIVPGLDYHAGWDVRIAGAQNGGLF